MSDFMQRFYHDYIFPQTVDIREGEYLPYAQDVWDHIPEDHKKSLYKWEEFLSIQAFLLGFRTAAGLSSAGALTENGTAAPLLP